MVESVLDAVPGLGRCGSTLLTQFSSLKKLRAASLDDLLALPGFGPSPAQAVLDALAQEVAGEAINTATGEVTEV